MHKDGYFSSGEFAKMTGVTKKTLRYYDEKNLLKPSLLTESGARFYSDQDLLELQRILLLKYLGFSLSDIREMLLSGKDSEQLGSFLQVQKKLVEDKIEQLKLVEKTITDTYSTLSEGHEIDWSNMLQLLRVTGMENSIKNQYRNASNISARISLHSMYAGNPEGWFPWIYENLPLEDGIRVLEIGCGDGALWQGKKLPSDAEVVLSDISDGMLRDAARRLQSSSGQFRFQAARAESLPFPDNSFDLVVANHVLFYSEDIEQAIREIRRVLRPGGMLVAGTYGRNHMKEIGELVTKFDERIRLSEGHLYERFGKENGEALLRSSFRDIQWLEYPDHLLVTEAEPLISYVLSCHGNQNEYIVDSYPEFKAFVKKRTDQGFYITKEAGIFTAICEKR